MSEVVAFTDALEPSLVEMARAELAAYERRTPDVAALATLASLARSVEPELLRSLRVNLGPRISGARISVSAESALWFSNLVESRGADSITLLPEVLHLLRPRLANNKQLLNAARTIVATCHQSAPEVLQWEEEIVYLALTGQVALLEQEVLRGLRGISQSPRQPLINWIADMWLRLPAEARLNPLLSKLNQVATGLVGRRSRNVSGGPTSATDLVLDFSFFPTRQLGVVLRDHHFLIGDLADAAFGIEVPDLEPVELDVLAPAKLATTQPIKIARGGSASLEATSEAVSVRTLAGRIYELSPGFFRTPARRFTVALAYPDEYRDFVSQVAGQLAAAYGEEHVLYDKFHEAEFARLDLNTYLPALYRKDSELIVVFLSPDYSAKPWSKLEGRHISQLIATLDAKRIMLLSFSNPGDLSDLGILSGDGYIDIAELTPEDVANKIQNRLEIAFPWDSLATVSVDISRIIKYAPEELIGREDELMLLNDAWAKVQNHESKRPHILTFVALGGEGKTSLVAKWAVGLAQQHWPGCDAAFAWSFYGQGPQAEVAPSSDLFLKEALIFFGDNEDKQFAASNAGAYEKGQRLARIVGARRALLILDGLELLQYAPTSPTPGEFKDAGLAALLKGLAVTNRGLCVVTTRYSISDLRAFRQTSAPEMKLLRLSSDAGVHLLRSLGVRGTDQEFEKLVGDVHGHALTLSLFGSYLRDVHRGDIARRDLVKLGEADAGRFGDTGLRVYATYVRWLESEGESGKQAVALWRLLGLFDRPASADCLSALWKGEAIAGLTEPIISMSESERNMSLQRLEDAKLLTVNRQTGSGELISLDAHPLLREYFAQELRTQQPEAWRAAHRRLYEHLSTTTPDQPEPTLEDLQPLIQAIGFGCEADLHQQAFDKIYLPRVQRKNEVYLWRKLGAFGSDLAVMAHFFDEPWSHVAPSLSEQTKGFILYTAAFDLRALGRLIEALEPMKSALHLRVEQGDLKNAAINAVSLSELELTLGNLAGAHQFAEQALEYAERTGDEVQEGSARQTMAEVLHSAGGWEGAEVLFREAERIRLRSQNSPLFSTGSFGYCDLLLSMPEQVAWRTLLPILRSPDYESTAAACNAAIELAANALKSMSTNRGDLLSIALSELVLVRASLYESMAAISQGSYESRAAKLAGSSEQMDRAIMGFRRAGQQQYLAQGLLTRALMRYCSGVRVGFESAQSDLDEAWEIAERGPMKLSMADIHLYRARLFGGIKDEGGGMKYPWNKSPDGSPRGPKDDLDAAEKLINECGYHRRDEELADAKAAAKNW